MTVAVKDKETAKEHAKLLISAEEKGLAKSEEGKKVLKAELDKALTKAEEKGLQATVAEKDAESGEKALAKAEEEKKALKAEARKALTKAENMLTKAVEERQKEVQKRIRAECHAVELNNSTEHYSHWVVRSLDKLADADADESRNVRTTHRIVEGIASAITADPADPPPNGLLAAAVCKRDSTADLATMIVKFVKATTMAEIRTLVANDGWELVQGTKAFPVGLPEDYERMKVRVAKKGNALLAKRCRENGVTPFSVCFLFS